MGKSDFKTDMKDKYGLTGMEVDDIMRYMKALCHEFQSLAEKFKTEYLFELKTHTSKTNQNKTEKNNLLKLGKTVLNRLSGEAKALKAQYIKTQKARELLITSLRAHKVSGMNKSIITDILGLMDQHEELRNPERVITGRRAYESLEDAEIGV